MNDTVKAVTDEARGFKLWPVENAYDFPDKDIPQGDVVLDSDHGAVLTAGGILQLTGAGKIGKSMLLLNLCYGLAHGKDVLSFKIGRARKVLYVNGENSPGTMQERLRCLRDYYCLDDESAKLTQQNLLFASTGLLLPRPDAVKEMRGNLSEIRPEVVILDPLKNFYSGEENSADNMREFMGSVRQLITEFGVTVIIAHHTGKKQNESALLYTGRGSSVLADDAEVTASFQKDASEKGRFTLSVTGRNCDEFALHLIRQPERWYLYQLADKPVPVPDHTLIEILDALPAEFSTGQFQEVAAKKGLSIRTANRRIQEARDFGLIVKDETVKIGRFRKTEVMPLPPPPKEVNDMAQLSGSADSVMPSMPSGLSGRVGGGEPQDSEPF